MYVCVCHNLYRGSNVQETWSPLGSVITVRDHKPCVYWCTGILSDVSGHDPNVVRRLYRITGSEVVNFFFFFSFSPLSEYFGITGSRSSRSYRMTK